MNRRTGWTLAIAASALFCCVLSFYQATAAAPPAGTQPFANSLQQRMEMITELKGIRALLKEQNVLLREQNNLLRPAEAKTVDSPRKR